MNTANDKRLFWACFISLVTTAFGFIIRALIMGEWATQFGLTETEKGALFGVGLWPFAISIVLFSLVIDRIGYGRAMTFAFICHVASAIVTICAPLVLAGEGASSDEIRSGQRMGYWMLYIGNFIVALGNGTVEAAINPVVATMFSKEKTKWLNILHAGWPGGLVLGGVLTIAMGTLAWEYKVALILIPTAIYGLLMLTCKFPVSERVEAGVTYKATLQEAGILGCFLVLALIVLQVADLVSWTPMYVYPAAAIGLLLLVAYAIYTQAIGRILFFVLMLIMIPLATTELGTDSWISDLMSPEMAKLGLSGGWVLVYTSAIMMVLRFYAGPIVHRFSPLGLLAISAAVAAVGLGALSISSGLLILGAATLYGFGKTFFWPTMLGVVAEQFPRGGALTLNSIAAVGMLSVGVIGNPLFGVIQDHQIEQRLAEKEGLHENLVSENTGIFGKYQAIDPEKMKSFENKLEDLKAKKSKLTEKIESTEDESKKQNLIAEKKTLTKEKIEPLATNIALVQTTREEVKKNTLLWVAILPVIMLICYLLLIVYFRAKGGYQAEVLTGDAAEDEKFVGGVEGAMEA